MAVSPLEIMWQAPEYEERQKGVSWYWISILVAIALLVAAIWQKNFLFGFFVIVAEILVLLWANQKPPMISFKLNERGIAIGNRLFYSYSDLSSFSIKKESVDAEWPALRLSFTKPLRTNLKIHVPKNRLEEVQKALKASVKEVDIDPTFFDTLQDLSGF